MIKINNPAFNYDEHGHKYSGQRQADPRIADYVNRAIGTAKSVLNVGAGSGNYEPSDKYVIAVEPSSVMREQRLKLNRTPAIKASADNLPFDDSSFDTTMAILTVHHWLDLENGLKEVKRVTRERIVIMTFDPDSLDKFWNAEYFGPVIEIEKARYPRIDDLKKMLGGVVEVIPIPIPLDCTDGFQEAFYGRPEAFLRKEVRMCQSAWGFLQAGIEEKLVHLFEEELNSGNWDKKFGHFRTEPTFTGALRLIVAHK